MCSNNTTLMSVFKIFELCHHGGIIFFLYHLPHVDNVVEKTVLWRLFLTDSNLALIVKEGTCCLNESKFSLIGYSETSCS